MISGKGMTSSGTLDIFCGGITTDVNQMESTLKALELYPPILLVFVLPLLSEIDVYLYSFILHSFSALV